MKVKEFAVVVSGATPKTKEKENWGGDNLWITPAEIKEEDKYIYATERNISEKGVQSASLTKLPKDTILLSSRAPIGKVAIVGKEMYCNQGFKNLICNTDIVIPEYIYYWLKSKKDYLNSLGRGATFKEISKSIVENIEIPMIEIEAQKKVVKILNHLESCIKSRKQQLSEFDLLVKSQFVEMFGDVQKNTKKWEMNTLNEIADIRSGGTPSRQNEEYFKGNIPWITTVALGKININEKDAVEFITEEAIKNSSTKLIPAYSLLFGVRVGVGKISVNTVPMCTNQDIVAIMNIDDNRYNQIFLKNVIDVYFEYFNNQKRGATIQGIKSEVLKNINIPVVDISLQNQFVTFVQQVDKSKLAVQKSLEELETLKQALMQQYFGVK